MLLGTKSGTYSIFHKAWELGLAAPEQDVAQKLLAKIKGLSRRAKRAISEEEFRHIYAEVMPG